MFVDFERLNISPNIFAHRKGDKKKETLQEHSILTKKYLQKLIAEKRLEEVICCLLDCIPTSKKSLVKRMFYNAVFLHDLGKNNPSFQRNKMDNLDFEETTASSNHSYLSANEFIKIFKNEVDQIEDDVEFYRLLFVLYNFAYQISKHHGRLGSFEDFVQKTKNEDLKEFEQNLKYFEVPGFEFYILNKLLFSLLVSSDYYATTEYMTDIKSEDFGLFNTDLKAKLSSKIEMFKNAFPEPEGINTLRSKMLKETEEVLNKNYDKNIYYLEAPTGSGKTITSINLALNLLINDEKLNKLFYIFPFNTLVEQTKNVFQDIFKKEIDIEVINSITPINVKDEKQEDDETKYQKSYLNRLFFHNPIIMTTHIALFKILFGTSKEDNYPLWQLANSVIIIDEVQSYDNNLWWFMVEFFQKYAKCLNMKIIIMSATLPKLDVLLDKPIGFVDLIEDRTVYFEDSYFKDRVEIDFSLLENETFQDEPKSLREKRIEKLLDKFASEKDNFQKFLFEFIRKETAREIFDLLKEKYGDEFKIFELTGDDNKAYRDFVILETKQDQNIIVVATQVIEAGVDIDMDCGFKDISTIDSEEQFLGRINRSCTKKRSKAFFFYLDNEQVIYKKDNRLEFNLRKKEYQKWLKSKNFQDFYSNVLERIGANGRRISLGLTSEIEAFKKDVSVLDYKTVFNKMTLIKSQSFTIFFPFKIDLQQYNIEDFQKLDKMLLDGEKLDGDINYQGL